MSSEHQSRAVAVIGMAGVFPGADDLDAFEALLAEGRDLVRSLPEARRLQAGLPEREHILAGYLDRVDAFDHAFFGVSRGEADHMDPQQRLALQLAVGAVQDAGYDVGALRGSRTAVVLAAVDNEYARLAGAADGAAVVGTTRAAVAGKVAYHLDLRGPALMVDTSCSSSLVALHDACWRLLAGEADLALAGGLNVYVFFPERDFHDPLGVAASDGRCKTFDARADGTGIGEGAGLLLLKPLERALLDRDPIRAVIRGSAVNHDGGRSNGMAAPSPEAQTEVILEAWRRAGVAPGSIGAIEAHGTGTQLGDPIEVQALLDAFGASAPPASCALGSVKTNVGHLGAAAGVAGVVKAVLGLERGRLYPSLHFREPNPHLRLDGSPLYVNTRLGEWPAGPERRRIGVSSFGISGTNAHALLEQAPEPQPAEPSSGQAQLVKLGARTPEALARLCRRLARHLEGARPDLADLAFTLDVGRDDHRCRAALVVRGVDELARELLRLAARPPAPLPGLEARPVFLLVSGQAPDAAAFDPAGAAPRLGPLAAAWQAARAELDAGPGATGFALGVALHAQWHALGLRPARLLGSGHGNLLVRVLSGAASLAQAAAAASSAPPAFERERFAAFLRGLGPGEAPLWLELDAPGPLSQALAESGQGAPLGRQGEASDEAGWLACLARLYEQGAALDWAALFAGQARRRLRLPTYPFEPVACFARVAGPPPAERRASAPEPLEREIETRLPPGATPMERAVGVIWLELLRCERLAREDDFFQLGGSSLHFTQMQTRLEQELGVQVDFETLLEHPTLGGLAACLESLQAESTPAGPGRPPLRRRQTDEARPLSFAQERLYYLYRLEPGSPYYNMPAALLLEGALDTEALAGALADVVARHEVLRSVYTTAADGRVLQRVRPDARLDVRRVDLTGVPAEARQARLQALAADEAAAPFDLSTDLALRATLVSLEDRRHALLLNMHHIASDGWSVGVLARELQGLYAARRAGRPAALAPLPVQYADYAEWQREWLAGGALERQRAYWRQALAGAPRLSTLPSDRPRPASSSQRGAWIERRFPAQVRAGLEALARRTGATTFMLSLAALFALLQRHSGQTDLCVGAPLANRVPRETEALIGFFANTLALRADLGGDPPFLDVVQAVRRRALDAFAHADLPFEQVVQALGLEQDARVSPLFQVALAYQNVPLQPLALEGLAVSSLKLPGGSARFDLAVSLVEDGAEIACLAEYSRDLFDDATAARVLERYERLLAGACAAPETRLSELPFLSPDEHEELLRAWSRPVGADAYRFD